MRWFQLTEFRCRCARKECDAPDSPAPELIRILEQIRAEYGMIIITSGLRCAWHDAMINRLKRESGKPMGSGEHVRGLAADVYCPTSPDRYRLVTLALKNGVQRLGVSGSFVHIGVDQTLPGRVIWTY